MPSEPSSGNSFKGWILGILGTVIAAVLVFWIQQKLTQKTPPAQPSHVIISVNGRVFDRAAKRLLDNAVVRLHLQSLQEQQTTDSQGRYAFSVEDFDPRLSGSMQIEAAGYRPLIFNLSLQEMSAMQDQFLDALSPTPPTGAGAAVDGSAGGAAARPTSGSAGGLAGASIARYVVRSDVRRLSALVNHQ